MTAALAALICPQCAAPLPRAARWRTVTCLYCASTVVRGSETVQRAAFAAARARANAPLAAPTDWLWRGARYRTLLPLARGDACDVALVRRVGPAAERVTLKLAREVGAAPSLEREAEVLGALQALDTPGAAYFSRRLPVALGVGVAEAAGASGSRQALALRHPAGHWGSLAQVVDANPQGIAPRHAVWLWRRMLEVLAFVHGNGWVHGGIGPDHALVHPENHGVLLIGWSRAHRPAAGAAADAKASDLLRCAWVIRTLLHGAAAAEPGLGDHTPAPLADLLRECSEDASLVCRLEARGIEAALSAAAAVAFGAPRFIVFNPAPTRA